MHAARCVWLLNLILAQAIYAQESQSKLDPESLTPAERLKILTASVEPYSLTLDKSREPLQLHPHPLLRFDNKVGGVVDGVVLMWMQKDRPAALAQVFVIKNGIWLHEFQSMSDRPLALREGDKRLWEPKRAGADWRPVPGAPAPEQSRAARLTQMKNIARQFVVTEDFRASSSNPEVTKYELRLLPQPAYRYAETNLSADGAIFAFVHGTDPEAILTLETQLDENEPNWKYAWAPLTCWGLQARSNDKEVWSVPEMFQKNSPSEPYHIWSFRPHTALLEKKLE